uniref:Uncharacterized protein n=1 Tax=Oryza barthii TaxID=65489 RepID=A0A0D3HJ72_9ORYZ
MESIGPSVSLPSKVGQSSLETVVAMARSTGYTGVREKGKMVAGQEEERVEEEERVAMHSETMLAASDVSGSAITAGGEKMEKGLINNVKEMLQTGQLEDIEIVYRKQKGGPALSAREFEKHALDKDINTRKKATHNQNDHIYLPSEVSVYQAYRQLQLVKSSKEINEIFNTIKNCKSKHQDNLQVDKDTGVERLDKLEGVERLDELEAQVTELINWKKEAEKKISSMEDKLEAQRTELTNWKKETEEKISNMESQFQKYQTFHSNLFEVLKKSGVE